VVSANIFTKIRYSSSCRVLTNHSAAGTINSINRKKADMKKIAILYFSGAGSTKKTADMIYRSIKNKCTARVLAIEQAIDLPLDDYDGLIRINC